jgi:hypothetical protein
VSAFPNFSSSFGTQSQGGQNFMQALAGLFGQQQQGGFGAPNYGGWQHAPRDPSYSASAPGFTNYNENSYWQRGPQQGPGGGFVPTYGQALAGALANDYQRAEAARQQEFGAYQGLLANLFGSMQGAGQMVQDARGAAGQNMGMLDQQAQQMRQAADQGNRFFEQSKSQMLSGLDEARQRMDQGIDTMRQARSGFDANYRGHTAAEVMGVQQQYKNELDQIARRDDLTQEQKDIMSSELQQSMRQQSSSLAAQASVRARDTLLALDQNIAQMESTTGSTLGQFGIGIGQMIGQLGGQQAALQAQNEQQISSFYNNMAQFNSSLMQNAQATALNYVLSGNQLAANIINSQPFGPLSLFETMVRAVDVTGANRRDYMSPGMSNLFGRLA